MNNKWNRVLMLIICLILTANLYKIQYILYMTDTEITDETNTEQLDENIPEIKTEKYNLSLKVIEDEQEVWKTYKVDVIESRESVGIYWLNNSKTEGYKIKIKFNEDGTVDVSEHTEQEIKVRHLAKLNGGCISIDTYDKIVKEVETNESNSAE